MWSPKNFDFSEDSPSLFLLSAWQELFHGFTPDSFQPRLHNVASLISELADVGRRCANEPRFSPHLDKIKAELRVTIDDEKRHLCRIPTYRSCAIQLAMSNTPEAIIAGASILEGERQRYRNAFLKHAQQSVAQLPKCKDEALSCIRRLATFSFQQGKEEVDVWEPLVKDTAKSTGEIFDDMISLSKENDNEYQVTLSVAGYVKELHSVARKQGFTIISRAALPSDYVERLSDATDPTLHVQLTTNGKSIRNAVEKARKQLSLDMGLVSLYTNPPGMRLHPNALVQFSGQDRIFIQSEQAFRRLHPRRKAKDDISEAIDLIKSHKIDSRLLAAVEQLALASATTDSRTRFINLWTSLETLAGVHEGRSTLERVCDMIVPVVVSRQVHRRIRYLAVMTRKFGDEIGDHDYSRGIRPNKTKSIWLDDLLATLTSVEHDPKISDLLSFARHPLLRHHIYSAWKKFHNPKALSQSLQSSKQRLEWQLARIYRARNLLIHEGEEVPHIVPLLDNLQNYLSMLVQRLIHELKSHPELSIRSLIEFWRGRMLHSFSSLAESPSVLTSRDFLEQGDIVALWPESDKVN